MLIEKNMDNTNSGSVDNLIAKYLGGNASEDEILMLESWIRESDENLKYFRQFKNIWEASVELPVSTDKALTKVLNQINSRKRRLTYWQILQRIAAILFIPLLISMLWLTVGKNFKNINSTITYNKVVAAFGTYSLLELPDGSKVWLNSGASLRYPGKFSKSNRSVYLIGEAYFEVHSDKTMPFYVNTTYFTVKATGTKFNVRAEKNFRTPSVTLIEGKVAVQKPDSGKQKDLITMLQPNQHMTYDTLSGHVTIQTEDTYKHFAWKDGKLVFRNDNISEVARRISLQYNVDIEIKGDEIKKYRYRATFENEPLGELLRLLKISSPIDYSEVKPQALPDGTFSRRKIIIFSIVN
jgi:ferric-dicitrate binding protein FerR (iron transport regulator)